MSTPGEWKTIDGRTMRIVEMEDSHLRNSLRYLYRQLLANPTARYFENKFVELAEEAQRRLILPQTLTEQELLVVVAGWEREVIARNSSWESLSQTPQFKVPQPRLQLYPVNTATLTARAEAPPLFISSSVTVAGEVMEMIRSRLLKPKKQKVEKVERNISFEL